MWVNLLNWLRIFPSTIIYIRLLTQTLKEMVYFLGIFFLVVTMFGNVIFILNTHRT